MCTSGTGLAHSNDVASLATAESPMQTYRPTRRTLLKTGVGLAGLVAMPAIVRAESKEIVIGGPAGAAKYFNGDLFPVIEKKLGVKIFYEGSNSLVNYQKMKADAAAPKMSVVVMDDPVMLPAAADK